MPNPKAALANLEAAARSPRCIVTYADGRPCKLVALRLNPGSKAPEVKLYTKHCKMHGGRQELDGYLRRQAMAEARRELGRPTAAIEEALQLPGQLDGASPAGIVERARTCDELPTVADGASCPSSTGSTPSLRADPNPKAGGGSVLEDTTSIGPAICHRGEGSENSNLENKSSSFPVEERDENNLYTFQDRTLAKSFSKKLSHQGALSLNEELAMVKTLIQEELKHMKSGLVDRFQWQKLDKMLARADKMINTIAKLEETKKIMYTRESMKMDLMKVLNAIRKWMPEEDRRRGLAGDLVRLIGPTLSDPGDSIVMTREVFRKG